MDALPADLGQSDIAIVITASRLPGGEEVAASTTIDAELIEPVRQGGSWIQDRPVTLLTDPSPCTVP